MLKAGFCFDLCYKSSKMIIYVKWRDEWFTPSFININVAYQIKFIHWEKLLKVIQTTTTTPRLVNTIQAISFHMTSYYAFINYKVSFYIEL